MTQPLIDLGAAETLQDIGRKLIVASATVPRVTLTLQAPTARVIGRMIEDGLDLRALIDRHTAAVVGMRTAAEQTMALAMKVKREAEVTMWWGAGLSAVGLAALAGAMLVRGMPG